MTTMNEVWTAYQTKHVDRFVLDQGRLKLVWSHLAPHFGHLTPAEIHEGLTDDYQFGRINGVEVNDIHCHQGSQNTIRKEIGFLRTLAKWGAKNRLLTQAEIEEMLSIELPTQEESQVVALTRAQWDAMVEQAGEDRGARSGDHGRLSRLERFLHIGLLTGARTNSIERLPWPLVNFEAGQVRYTGLNTPERMRAKRAHLKKKVDVTIGEQLLPVLERAFQERVTDYVLDRQTPIYDAFKRCALRAGHPDLHPHMLRHTCASWMLSAGVSLWRVAGVLGDSVKTVERTYGHFIPKDLREAVDAITL